MNEFVLGMVAMTSLVASMFFLRFWRTTRDRFFLYFAAAFAIDAASRIGLALTREIGAEHEPLFYLLRLVTFGLIVAAIAGKNAGLRSDGATRPHA